MLRLFVGLALPDPIRDELALLCSGLPGARWVDDNNFHITLRFIGEVDEHAAGEIDFELSKLRAGAFRLSLAGLGTFGQGHKTRALWVRVEPDPALDLLQGRVEAAVARAGIAREARKFTPHVTLARFNARVPDRLQDYIAANNLFRAGPFAVEEFVLFESRMGKGGSVYHALQGYPLQS
ncbi:MAG: RNA 2',3'-cyclic phosphodiesterase [Rhodospirillaceae bacterium]|nr:RNA 2',3'-cyclic phosphodiesterase [Rhodospirillaceae bacterium]